MNLRLWAGLLLAIAAWSAQAADLSIRLTGPVVRPELSSGSGMTWHGGRYFVVGDDAAYLFTLDPKFAISGRTRLARFPVQADGRIAKHLKPDYEAMATVTHAGAVWNLILGSGSRRGTRQTGLLVATDGRSAPRTRDMAALYGDFARLAGFAPGVLVNIEALAIARGDAWFFNRGNAVRNILYRVSVDDLMAYMGGSIDRIEHIDLHEASLPRLGGREAGFSGADYWPEIDSLVFTASVEGADNAIDDGAVLGSYVGLIALARLKDRAPLDLRESAWLLTQRGMVLKTKVESIALRQTTARRARGALVSDNDDGSSEFFDVELTLTSAARR
ncbi:hypothetical protein QTH87_11370 [Variovorax sp. J22P168]|uniref:DUF6929 family protein n=1 Tax=Variovorax jilinensis TaxID=3053513 RepID=UPI0025777434|nr:hypothetical protein [Variovorax sp. J22P168]MDM0013032.1 hypothetical protein [Variovorax sp. J22P168]